MMSASTVIPVFNEFRAHESSYSPPADLSLSIRPPESEDRVEAAKSERIRKSELDGGCAGCIWNNIEIASWIELGEVGRGRKHTVVQSEQRGRGFDGAGSAECMAVHGFGGTDRETIGMGAEDFADGRGFCRIVR